MGKGGPVVASFVSEKAAVPVRESRGVISHQPKRFEVGAGEGGFL